MTWSTTVMVMLHVFLSSLHIFTSLGNISRTSISSLFHQKEREYNSRMFTGGGRRQINFSMTFVINDTKFVNHESIPTLKSAKNNYFKV